MNETTSVKQVVGKGADLRTLENEQSVTRKAPELCTLEGKVVSHEVMG